MRRLVTSLVVGGVVVLAVLAAADALRSRDEANVVQPSTTVHPRGRPTLPDTLRRDAISGQLIYSDFLCRLRTIQLPSLQRDQVLADNGSELAQCEFSLGAGHLLPGGTAVSQDGATAARCVTGRLTVRNIESDAVVARARGCPAAWRPFPDGRSQLTHVQAGEIVADGKVLVSRGELLRAARRSPNILGISPDIHLHVVVTEFVWLDQRRIVAILRFGARYLETQQMLALLDRGRLIGVDVSFEGPIRGLVASPHSNYVAAEPGTVMDGAGRSWQLPRTLAPVSIFGFSPDERWLAVGTRASTYLVSVVDLERGEPQPRINRVPILATHLVWEPGGVPTDTLRVG
jgi:hypothetical protein